MNSEELSTRRRFIHRTLRIACAAGLGGTAVVLARRAASETVFQVDPSRCMNCDEAASEGCDLCRTTCVLPLSAVKAVNDFDRCGYCMLCPAYYDITSEPDARGMPTGKVCPQDAIIRRVVGKEDPDDPNNNYYEYTIDEAKCDGCGKCVKACKPPFGNGSLRLEIRYDRCVRCNQCSILVACPKEAVRRIDVPGLPPAPSHQKERG